MEELTQGPCRGDASECGSSVRFGPGGRAAGMVRVAKCGVNRSRSGQHVSRMAERWQVAHVWQWLARALALPNGEFLSCMHLESSSKPSPDRLHLLDLLDIFRLRVWIPSFFMVIGLLIYKKRDSVS